MAPNNSVAVTIERPDNSVKAKSSAVSFLEKQKAASPKQFTWVLLLKVNRIFACLSWLPMAFRKRIALSDMSDEEPRNRGKLYRFIKAFLVLSIVALGVEVFAHYKNWNLNLVHQPWEVQGLVHWSYVAWLSFRIDYIAPVAIFLSKFCIVLFLIQSLDRLVLCLGCFWIKFKKVKPTIEPDAYDVEDPSSFPMVLLQIPMCNEREVYEQSIAAACQMDWPRDKLLIQVLDDSDDIVLQNLIQDEIWAWSQKGINIIYRHRLIRTGYKAGNLKSAMGCEYVKDYEFVAIFDADFTPNPDFLKLAVPHFKGNPELGLVQARWSFVNKDENLLTRLQNINLCFHFEVEQQVNGVFLNFFGFNGTAGVWRIKALEESGGWLERTTVEDMDIAVRAHLNGWKFIFLNDVKALCELPESYETYKKQQHRWHSGPMQLFRLCLPAILTSKISIWKKANLIFLFFLLRKLILPFYSFTLFCIILPLTMFIPEAELPLWVICYVPIFMSFLNILPSPKSFPFLVPYLLFENTMSVTKFNAMVSGLFQLGSSYEWVVTKKTGRSSESDLLALAERESSIDEKILRRNSESALHFPMSINQIELLNGFNYQKWRGDIELNLAILDFDHVLKEDPPTEPAATASKDVKEKYFNWIRHNKMALICIKKSMNSSVMGSIPDSTYAKEYMHSIAEKYKVSNKAETGRLMNKLTGLKYNGGSIREYIMKGVDIAEKLKGMKMNIEEPFLVFLLLNSFPEEYSHLKSLYNTQKEKWSVNELISICVQEEEDRAKKGKEVDINYISKPKNKKHFGKKHFPNKDGASSSSMRHDLNKGKPHKSSGPMKCFFCKKKGHFKKDCDGFKNWLKKKGIIQTNNPKKE